MIEEIKEPRLRFKGFEDDWKIKKLSSISSIHARIGWQNLRTSEFLKSGQFLLITGTDFKNGKVNFKSCFYVSKDRYDQDKKIQVKNGNVLVTKDGTLGKVAYVEGLTIPATLNAGVFNITINNQQDVNSNYLFHFLRAPFLMRYAKMNATGGTIKHLNQGILVNFPVQLPSINEQLKIASFLNALDRMIELQQVNLKHLKRLKKGYLQKMFTDRDVPRLKFKDFDDKWKINKLGNIANITRGASPRPIKDPKWFNKDSNVGWLRISDVTSQNGRIRFIKQKLSKLGENKTRVLKKPTVLLSIAASVGYPAINYVNTGVHDGFLIFNDLNLDKEFLFQWFLNFRKNWKKYSQPGSQLNLNSNLVSKQNISVPLLQEQTKIGYFFQLFDHQINLSKSKLESLKKTKQAYLQKMFI